MISARTLSAPSASVASVATRLESTPPLRPRTTRSKPTLRTSLRMNPTRMPRTSSGLIRSGGKIGSVRLAGTLMPDPAQLIDGQLDALVAKQWIGEPLAADVTQIEVGQDELLVRIFLLRDDVAVRTDHHRAAPEVRAILITHAVAVEKERCQELGIGAAEEAVGLGRSEALVGRDPAAGAGRRANDHVHAFEAQDVGAGEVPDVLADQHPRPAKSCLETAKAIAGSKVAMLVEHAVGRKVYLAVNMDQLAAAEVQAGVEVAMVGILDDAAQHDVQVFRQCAQLAHHGTVQRDRAFRHQVLEEVAGQAELGEDQQLDTGLGRLSHPLPMPLEIASPVAEGRVHLHQPNCELAVLPHAGTGLGRGTPPPRASHCAIAGAISSDWPRCTAARGRASRKALPYVRFAMRWSIRTTAPRSLCRRISRPKPCLRRKTASGSASCPKGSARVALRASWSGSLGTRKGRRTITTQERASPGTSIPSQKLLLPNKMLRGSSWNCASSCRRVPSRFCASTVRSLREVRSRNRSATSRSC